MKKILLFAASIALVALAFAADVDLGGNRGRALRAPLNSSTATTGQALLMGTNNDTYFGAASGGGSSTFINGTSNNWNFADSSNVVFRASGTNALPYATNLDAGLISQGTLSSSRLPTTGTAGTYTKVTTDAQGRVSSGTSATLASADFANQGTTTTLLHGNAGGNPSFAAVSDNDISGPISQSKLATTGSITTDTLTAGKTVPSVETLTDAATVTINFDKDGGLLASVSQTTTFANPTGATNALKQYVLAVKSSSVRTVSFGTKFRGSSANGGLALPASTVGGGLWEYWKFLRNNNDDKFDYVGNAPGY